MMDPNKKYRVAFVIEVTGDDVLATLQNQAAAHLVANEVLRATRLIATEADIDPERIIAIVDPLLRSAPKPGISSVLHDAYTWRPFGLFDPERPSEKVMRLMHEQREASRAAD